MKRKLTIQEKLNEYAHSKENTLIKRYSLFSILIGVLMLFDFYALEPTVIESSVKSLETREYSGGGSSYRGYSMGGTTYVEYILRVNNRKFILNYNPKLTTGDTLLLKVSKIFRFASQIAYKEENFLLETDVNTSYRFNLLLILLLPSVILIVNQKSIFRFLLGRVIIGFVLFKVIYLVLVKI